MFASPCSAIFPILRRIPVGRSSARSAPARRAHRRPRARGAPPLRRRGPGLKSASTASRSTTARNVPHHLPSAAEDLLTRRRPTLTTMCQGVAATDVACARIHPVRPFGRPGSRTCSQLPGARPSSGRTVRTPVRGTPCWIDANGRRIVRERDRMGGEQRRCQSLRRRHRRCRVRRPAPGTSGARPARS